MPLKLISNGQMTASPNRGTVYTGDEQKPGKIDLPNGLHNYSTEEQVVGTWIDGKPVYESTIDLGYDVRISGNADSIFPNQDILNELECETFLDAFAIFNDDKYIGYRNPIEIGKADDTYTYKAMEDWPAKSDRHVICYLKYTKTTD